MTEITKPLPGATIDYGHPTNRGLLGRWLFNEGAGSRLADISGNGNHGTATNIDLTSAWGGSIHGRALAVNGVDDRVVVSRSNSLRPLTSLSVSAWINSPGVGGSETILSHYVTTGNQRSWAVSTSAGGTLLEVRLSDDGTLAAGTHKYYQNSTTGAVFDGTWHHIGFTFDGPSSALQIYIDGAADVNQVKANDAAINSLHDSTGDINFGSIGNPSQFWDGHLSDVSIYDRALNSFELRELQATPYLGLLD